MKRYGHNVGYIDELHRRYLEDPSSVGEAWQEFFADYRPGAQAPVLPRPGKIDDAMLRFEAYTRRIDDVEGRVEAYDLGLPKDLNHEFAGLEAEESVNKELDALKARVAAERNAEAE